MLAMEKGGSDVIELGVPFTDPLADGKAIQEANNVCLYVSLSLYAHISSNTHVFRSSCFLFESFG